MRSSLVEARPASSAQGYPPRSAPYPQRSPVPPVTPQAKKRRIPLSPAEGWLPLFLLAVAVYSVVYSVTAAIAISHNDVLWLTTAMGLVCGLVVSKSRYFPQAVLHIATCILGYWLALFLTSSLAYHVSLLTMLASLHAVITDGFALTGTSQSDMVFLFYLAFLCFFLGYFGSWLIYRAHLPWLVALVYVSIMIVNLNYIAKRDLSFLVVILIAALIPLIARVQLAGQLTQWKNEGLYTDQVWLRNLTTRFLRIVSLFVLLILPLGWLLPVLSQPTSGVTLWNNLDNAWANLSHGNFSSLTNPGTLFSPYQPSANFFSDQLSITGSVNLPNGPVLSYTSSSPATGQYLEGFSFDDFDGHTWTSLIQSSSQLYSANTQLPSGDATPTNSHLLNTSITVLQPPGGTKHFIFAPPRPSTFTVPVTILTDPTGNFTTAWTQTAPLQQNEKYTVVSAISTASSTDLGHVALPTNDPGFWANNVNYNELQQYYLQIPRDLSSEVLATAKTWTQGFTTTYDVVSALRSHLSDHTQFTYSLSNPPIPSNIDAVTWLLHTHHGYCTYYATAMVVMARLLKNFQLVLSMALVRGITISKQQAWVVDGSDAHSWVQVYFPGSGWVNFDPTPGYSINNAGVPTSAPTPSVTKPPVTSSPTTTSHKQITPTAQPTTTARQTGGKSTTRTAADTFSTMNFFLLIALLALIISCVVLALAVKRYRRNRSSSRTAIASIYTRLCRIAGLVGSPPASWQTPYEYTFTLSKRFPQASAALHRVAELFVRERWAAPQQAPAPGEQQELERLWPGLRNTLLRSPFSKGR